MARCEPLTVDAGAIVAIGRSAIEAADRVEALRFERRSAW
jgi:hypothetical protein